LRHFLTVNLLKHNNTIKYWFLAVSVVQSAAGKRQAGRDQQQPVEEGCQPRAGDTEVGQRCYYDVIIMLVSVASKSEKCMIF